VDHGIDLPVIWEAVDCKTRKEFPLASEQRMSVINLISKNYHLEFQELSNDVGTLETGSYESLPCWYS